MNYRIIVSFVFVMGLHTSLFSSATSENTPPATAETTDFCPGLLVEHFLTLNEHFCSQIPDGISTKDRITIKTLLLDFTKSSVACVALDCVKHLQEVYDNLITRIEALDSTRCIIPLTVRLEDYDTGDPSIILCDKIIQCIERALDTTWSNDTVKIVAAFLIDHLSIIVNYYSRMNYFKLETCVHNFEKLNNKICLLGAYDGTCNNISCRVVAEKITSLKHLLAITQLEERNAHLRTYCSKLSLSIVDIYQKKIDAIAGNRSLTDDMAPAINAVWEDVQALFDTIDTFFDVVGNTTSKRQRRS